MIRVLFFAQLREQLGTSSLELAPEGGPATVAELRTLLQARGPEWQRALAADNILCAVNQRQVTGAEAVRGGDEVAFFPPVTGG